MLHTRTLAFASSLLLAVGCGRQGLPPVSSVGAPRGLSYPDAPIRLATDVPLPALVPRYEGAAERWDATPPLPSGLTLDARTGVIRGTPTTRTPRTDYLVTASNAGGRTSTRWSCEVGLPVLDLLFGGAADGTVTSYHRDPRQPGLVELHACVTGGHPAELCVQPGTGRVVAVDTAGGRLMTLTVDARTGEVRLLAAQALQGKLAGLAVGGDRVFVADTAARQVHALALDPATGRYQRLSSAECGIDPIAILATRTGRDLYVVCRGSNEIWHYDIEATYGLLRFLDLARTGASPRAMLADQRQERLFVADQTSNDVTVFAIAPGSGKLTRIVQTTTSREPRDLAVDEERNLLHVLCDGSRHLDTFRIAPDGTLAPADSLALEAPADRLLLEPDGKVLRVYHRGRGSLRTFAASGEQALVEQDRAVLHTETLAFAARPGALPRERRLRAMTLLDRAGSQLAQATQNAALWATGRAPQSVAWHPAGTSLFCTNYLDDSISAFLVDPATGVIRATGVVPLPVGIAGANGPAGLAIAPTGNHLYVSYSDANAIATFAIGPGASLHARGEFVLGNSPRALAFAPGGRLLAVALASEVAVLRVDPASGDAVASARAPVGFGARALAFAPGGRFLYVASEFSNEVQPFAVDPLTGMLTPLAVRPTGAAPITLAIDPAGGLLVVGLELGNSLQVFAIDKESGQLHHRGLFACGRAPAGLAFEPGGRALIVACSGEPLLQVFAVDPVLGKVALDTAIPFLFGPTAVALLSTF